MEYIKKGLVFQPNAHYDWMHYYAAPVSSIEMDDCIRVFFTTRGKIDEHGNFRSVISFVDCDKKDPSKVLRINDKPLLELGAPGTFDEHGTMIADVIKHEGKYYMYYMGWQRSGTVPYIIRMGLALSSDGINFEKLSEGPVIGVNRFVPFGIGSISIIYEDNKFNLWYTHYNHWIKTEKSYRPTYDIRFGTSENGMDWKFDDHVCLSETAENVLATPCVRNFNGVYHMWYSIRRGVDANGNSGPYRIAYATSNDKVNWELGNEKIGLDVSATGWDSEMICYPDILTTEAGDTFIFYCGNHYGRDGFGYAQITGI